MLGGARSLHGTPPSRPVLQISCPVAQAPRGLQKVEMCAPDWYPRPPVTPGPAVSQLPGSGQSPREVSPVSCAPPSPMSCVPCELSRVGCRGAGSALGV